MLKSQVISVVYDCFQLPKGAKLVLGVSGGADSMALLYALKDGPWQLSVGHFNHQIREAAAADAAFVAQTAEAMGVPCYIGTGDVPSYTKESGKSIEEAAREMRYDYLAGLVRKLGAQALAVAHNQDDNLETILMHFLRGSGLDGLRGIAAKRFVPGQKDQILLLRPLLGWNRAQILHFCEENKVPFVEDQSNQDLNYYRNRLRHTLMPQLDELNPAWRKNLLRNAQLAAQESHFLDQLAEEQLQSAFHAEDSEISLKREPFLALHQALQTRTIRKAVQKLVPNLRDFGYEQSLLALKTIQQSRRRMDLGDGLELLVDQEEILLRKKGACKSCASFPQISQSSRLQLGVPDEIMLGSGFFLQSRVVSGVDLEKIRRNKDPNQAWFQYPQTDITVRRVQPGERMQPLGMRGSQKISDIFINAKIPQAARENWPLLCFGGQAAWLVGLRQDSAFQLQGDEEKILHLQLLKDKDA